MPGVRLETVEDESIARFVHEAMLGLAVLEPEDLANGNLTLPLGISLWMRRGKVRVDAALAIMLGLRSAVLASSGLDERTEPVPMLLSEPAAAVISVALYMHGLLHRAARAAATSRLDMARRAVALVGGATPSQEFATQR